MDEAGKAEARAKARARARAKAAAKAKPATQQEKKEKEGQEKEGSAAADAAAAAAPAAASVDGGGGGAGGGEGGGATAAGAERVVASPRPVSAKPAENAEGDDEAKQAAKAKARARAKARAKAPAPERSAATAKASAVPAAETPPGSADAPPAAADDAKAKEEAKAKARARARARAKPKAPVAAAAPEPPSKPTAAAAPPPPSRPEGGPAPPGRPPAPERPAPKPDAAQAKAQAEAAHAAAAKRKQEEDDKAAAAAAIAAAAAAKHVQEEQVATEKAKAAAEKQAADAAAKAAAEEQAAAAAAKAQEQEAEAAAAAAAKAAAEEEAAAAAAAKAAAEAKAADAAKAKVQQEEEAAAAAARAAAEKQAADEAAAAVAAKAAAEEKAAAAAAKVQQEEAEAAAAAKAAAKEEAAAAAAAKAAADTAAGVAKVQQEEDAKTAAAAAADKQTQAKEVAAKQDESARPSEGVPPKPAKLPGGPGVACVVEVPEGSAGFTCNDSLLITRLDEGGLAELAGVTVGMRVCQFMGEDLPEFRTWTELKQVARVTPKPWTFSFAAVLAEGTPPPSPSTAAAKIDKDQIQRKRMDAVMTSLQTLISDDAEALDAELVGRVTSFVENSQDMGTLTEVAEAMQARMSAGNTHAKMKTLRMLEELCKAEHFRKNLKFNQALAVFVGDIRTLTAFEEPSVPENQLNAIRGVAEKVARTIAMEVTEENAAAQEDHGLNLSGALGKIFLGADTAEDEARRRKLEPEARKMFAEVDVDGNGLLDPDELKQLASKLGMDLNEEQVSKVMSEIDTDGSGEVDFEEFFDWYVENKDGKASLFGSGLKGFFGGITSGAGASSPTKEQRREELHEEARAVFDEIDGDGNGNLDLEELKLLAERLGVKLDDAGAAKAMAEMDADKSGEVDFEEFFDWYVENKDRKGGLFGRGGLIGNLVSGGVECSYVTEGATVGRSTAHTCVLQWRVGGQSSSPPVEFHAQCGGTFGSWTDVGTWDLATVSSCDRGDGWYEGEVDGLVPGKRYQFRLRVHGTEGWGAFSKTFTGYTQEQTAEEAAAEAKHPLLALLMTATEDNETPIPPETMAGILSTLEQHPSLASDVLAMVYERMWVDSTTVKHKLLAMLSRTCSQGPPSFHNAVRSNEALMQELSKLRNYVATTPHPVHGEKPQMMIRHMSQQLISQLAQERVEMSVAGIKNLLGRKAAKGSAESTPTATPTAPVPGTEGHGSEFLSLQWTLLPEGCEPPAETEVQYGFRLKGSWKSAMRLEGSATSCRIGGLKPATGYVVRVRCKGRHGGGWSSWAKSLPMATTEETEEAGTPLAEDAEASMEAMYEALYIATEEGEEMPDKATLQEVVDVISTHGTLSSECIAFLTESFTNESSTVLLKTARVLGALLSAGAANPSSGAGQFEQAAKQSEALMSSLYALTKYSCEPHPTLGTKPQELVQQVTERLLTQLGAKSASAGGLGKLSRFADKAKAAADKALAAADADQTQRQPTLFLAKEMGVVRAAKEMASPKVAEIPSGATVEVVDEIEIDGRHRVQVVSPVVGWASVTAGDGTVLLEKMVA